jgi:hypothetical protein
MDGTDRSRLTNFFNNVSPSYAVKWSSEQLMSLRYSRSMIRDRSRCEKMGIGVGTVGFVRGIDDGLFASEVRQAGGVVVANPLDAEIVVLGVEAVADLDVVPELVAAGPTALWVVRRRDGSLESLCPSSV